MQLGEKDVVYTNRTNFGVQSDIAHNIEENTGHQKTTRKLPIQMWIVGNDCNWKHKSPTTMWLHTELRTAYKLQTLKLSCWWERWGSHRHYYSAPCPVPCKTTLMCHWNTNILFLSLGPIYSHHLRCACPLYWDSSTIHVWIIHIHNFLCKFQLVILNNNPIVHE
jgi:hypothetical protein